MENSYFNLFHNTILKNGNLKDKNINLINLKVLNFDEIQKTPK